MEPWCPWTDEPLERPVVLHLAIHHPDDPAVLGRGIARLEERALAVRELQTERRRRRVAAVDALRTSDWRTKDRRHLVLDLLWDRGPGRFGFSALPRHWTSAQSRGYAAETRSRLDDSLVADEPLLAQVSSHLLPRLAGFLDRALVLDRRDVTWVFVEDHRLQYAPHDLAASRLRQHVDEGQLADPRKLPEAIS